MNTPPSVLLGIDGGATHSHGVAIAVDGRVLASVSAGSLNFFGSGLPQARASLAQLLEALEQALPRGTPCRHAVIGCAALFSEATPREKEGLCAGLPLPGSTRVVSDSQTAHFGATLGDPGVVVIAGTGSMVLARGDSGRWAQVGGWGHLLGDEGSAHWIARESVQAAIASSESRGPDTELGSIICQFFGVNSLPDLIPILYDSLASKDRFADLARFLSEGGCDGDAVFQGILGRAGVELALQAAAAIRSAGFEGNPVPIFLIGSVLTKNRQVREAFVTHLQAVRPVRIETPHLPPTLGAAAMALGDAGIPLTSEVVANLRRGMPDPDPTWA